MKMKGVVGRKVRWQTSSTPLMLKRPQEIRGGRTEKGNERRATAYCKERGERGDIGGRMRVRILAVKRPEAEIHGSVKCSAAAKQCI